MKTKNGDMVRALDTITETDFLDDGLEFTHAQKGDLGVVREVKGQWSTVTWGGTGTTTICHASEFTSLMTARQKGDVRFQ